MVPLYQCESIREAREAARSRSFPRVVVGGVEDSVGGGGSRGDGEVFEGARSGSEESGCVGVGTEGMEESEGRSREGRGTTSLEDVASELDESFSS